MHTRLITNAEMDHPSSKVKRVGGMATMPSRIESLRVSIQHILPQVDRLYLYFDKYEEVPQEFALHPKIVPLLQKGKRLGCSGKFYGLKLYPEPCLYFCFDDDIIYPAGYVDHLEIALRRHFFRAIVGLHGVIYRLPLKSYARDKMILPFSNGLDFDVCVDELGTGTIALHSGSIKIDVADWEHANMSDLLVMIEAMKQQCSRICVRRPKTFLQPIGSFQPDSIYCKTLIDDTLETRLLQSHINQYPSNWCMSS